MAILSLAVASSAWADPGNRGKPRVLPPQSHPYGKSYGAWGAEWYKWVYSIPAAQNPISDTTGEFGDLHQSGPVWFLAGSFGTTVERTVTIPEGKGIFFPIFNYFNDYPCPDTTFHPAPGQSLEDFLAAGAAALIDSASTLAVQVDGNELEHPFNYRAASHLVTFTADPSWVTIDPCVTGSPQFGVSDGYWVMLAPLPTGEHTIHILATVDAWGFRLDVTYHITVSKPPQVLPAESHPYGKSFGEWSAEQWKWVYSLPVDHHPLYDTADVGTGQPFDHVWFLGGSYNATPDANGTYVAVAVRNVTIPAGTALFFPIIDSEASVLEGNGTTEAELRSFAQGLQDHAHDMTCTIDGKVVRQLDDYRVQSPLFTIGPLPANNVFENSGVPAPAGTTTPSVSDGVFVMVEPLSVGRHTIHFAGIVVFTAAADGFDFTFSQDITYHITVQGAAQLND